MSSQEPTFPLNEYAPEPLALYQYGRSSASLPLLEFLAYYQALEFFFPAFAHREVADALRVAILNPRFDPTDDTAIARLISLASPAVLAGVGERDQIRSTVRAIVTKDELREFIEEVDGPNRLLTSREAKIKGTSVLRLDSGDKDLRDQVAERIYAIRCRIVHTKSDSGSASAELLLPTSEEVRHLGADIALIRFIAQRAIFAGAKRPLFT